MAHFFFATILSIVSVFLILLVLVQRGRGGGLTGALGGMGGQSAFGTKAGDTFTRVTIIAATVWILLAIIAVKLLGGGSGPLGDADLGASTTTTTTTTGGGATANPLGTGGADGSTAADALSNLPDAGASPAGTTPAGTAEPGTSGTGGASAEPAGDAEAQPSDSE